ncbi:MAG: iron-containing redox enzyme family protein [Planctomycetes bacterium]|nr:iron-containing redox enzyme family protein [Planctomycetota bacterium]
MKNFLERCEHAAAEGWRRIHRGPFWRHLRERGLDRELYAGLMAELFHSTRHNAQNQALAAVRVGSDRVGLLRYALQHALEEAGHDLMVLHDLKAIGVDAERVARSRPLPETDAFVAYLYRVAGTHDATARLGYSYWAESCYPHIRELLDAMRRDLGLSDAQMTFFVAHSEIDRDHFTEVEHVVATYCTTTETQAGTLEVLERTLHLQGAVIDAVHARWAAARARESVNESVVAS